MRVRFRDPQPSAISEDERRFVSPSQTFLTPGREYVVHAVSVYQGVVFVLIIDDIDTPIFRVRALFEIADSRIPTDWICNLFPDSPVQLVMGPPYVAKDLASYDGMVDHDGYQVAQLWKRTTSGADDGGTRAGDDDEDVPP